jgi:RNA polymerase sigma factor (sigma-70 family)
LERLLVRNRHSDRHCGELMDRHDSTDGGYGAPILENRADSELYRLAVAGNRSAVRAIAERYHQDLIKHGMAKTNSRATAEDAAANAWIRFFKHLKEAAEDDTRLLDNPGSLRFWLLTATRHSLMDLFRKEERGGALVERITQEEHVRAGLTYQPDFLERLTNDEQRRLMMKAFKNLSSPCRELMSLLLLDPPMDYSEIAATLGRPVGSIGPTRQRCIDRLRSLLAT